MNGPFRAGGMVDTRFPRPSAWAKRNDLLGRREAEPPRLRPLAEATFQADSEATSSQVQSCKPEMREHSHRQCHFTPLTVLAGGV